MLKPLVIAISSAMLLTACGGGGDGSHSKNKTSPSSPLPSGNKAPQNVTLVEVTSINKGDLTASWLPAKDDTTPANQLRYELHAGATADFIPNDSTKIYSGNAISANVKDKLTAGQKYFIKLVVYDKDNARTVSTAMPITVSSKDPVINANIQPRPATPTPTPTPTPKAEVVTIPEKTPTQVTDTQIIVSSTVDVPKAGGYIVSVDKDNPYLRKVVSTHIDPTTGNKVVKTTKVSIDEVVSEASVSSSFKMGALPKEVAKGLQTGLIRVNDNDKPLLEWQDSNFSYGAGSTDEKTKKNNQGLQLGLKSGETNIQDGHSSADKNITINYPSAITLTQGSNQTFDVSATRTSNSSDATICRMKPLRVETAGKGSDSKTIHLTASGELLVKHSTQDGKALDATQTFNVSIDQNSPLGGKYNLIIRVESDQQADNCIDNWNNNLNYSKEISIPISVVADDVLPQEEDKKLPEKQSQSMFKISGDVKTTFDPILETENDWKIVGGLKHARVAVRGNAFINQTLNIETRDANSQIDEQYDIIQPRHFYKVYVASGVPIIISGEMTLKMRVTGSATGKLKATETINLGYKDIEYGFEYKNGNYIPLQNATPYHNIVIHGEGEAEANLEVALVPSIKITAYEVVSGRAVLEPYLAAEAGIEGHVDFVRGINPEGYLGEGFDADYRLTKGSLSGGLNAYYAADLHVWNHQLVAYPKKANLNDVTAYNKPEGSGGYKKIELIGRTKFLGIPSLADLNVDYAATLDSDSRAILVKGSAKEVPFPIGKRPPIITWAGWTTPRVVNTQSTSQNGTITLDQKDNSKAWFIPDQAGTYTVRLGGFSSLGGWARQYKDAQLILKDDNKNGIPDYWERRYQVYGKDIHSDDDQDQLTLLQEWQLGKNPKQADNDELLSNSELPTIRTTPAQPQKGQGFSIQLTGGDQTKPTKALWVIAGKGRPPVSKDQLYAPIVLSAQDVAGKDTIDIKVTLYNQKDTAIGMVQHSVSLTDTAKPGIPATDLIIMPKLVLTPSTPQKGSAFNVQLEGGSKDRFAKVIWAYDGQSKTVNKAELYSPITLTTDKDTLTIKASLYDSQDKLLGMVNKTIDLTKDSTKGTGKLTATGITLCADDNRNNIVCKLLPTAWLGLGQDGEIQAGQKMSYTTLHQNGATCVQDNVTGLIWEQKTDDNGLRDKDWTYTWYNPDDQSNGGSAGYKGDADSCQQLSECNTQAYINALNQANYCGYSDWRLPEREELRSIVDYGRYNPAINTTFFPNTKQEFYWSSSPHANYSYNAWGVNFDYGNYDKGNRSAVRAVRSE